MKVTIHLDKKLVVGFGLGIGLCLLLAAGFLKVSKPTAYRYDEPVELSGTLNQKLFYGPPGFGTNPSEDEKEMHYLFVPRTPIKVAAGTTEFEKAYDSVDELQIINEKNLTLSSYFGQGIRVSGSLMAAQTGYHHTDVLLILDNISLTSWPTSQKEKTPEIKQKEYTFDTSSGKNFSFSYSPDLDLIEPTGYMVGERVRLKPKGETIEQSYLITVDQPATELGEGIYITWRGAPVNFGNNWYKRGDARSMANESQIALVIFNPLPPLPSDLGSIYVAPWDHSRLDEALQKTSLILKTLKEIK